MIPRALARRVGGPRLDAPGSTRGGARDAVRGRPGVSAPNIPLLRAGGEPEQLRRRARRRRPRSTSSAARGPVDRPFHGPAQRCSSGCANGAARPIGTDRRADLRRLGREPDPRSPRRAMLGWARGAAGHRLRLRRDRFVAAGAVHAARRAVSRILASYELQRLPAAAPRARSRRTSRPAGGRSAAGEPPGPRAPARSNCCARSMRSASDRGLVAARRRRLRRPAAPTEPGAAALDGLGLG